MNMRECQNKTRKPS